MKPYFLAICYHYIGSEYRYPYPGMVGITQDEFSLQLTEIAKYFEFIGIREISDNITRNIPLPNRSVAITFDDGLREQFENALPILTKMGIPFIFFVNSAPYTEKKVSKVHKIHYLRSVIKHIQLNEMVKRAAEDLCGILLSFEDIKNSMPAYFYPYDDDQSRLQKYILNFFLSPNHSSAIIDSIFSEYSSEIEFCNKFYMSEDQLKEVHYRYHALGIHGHNHFPLSSLSYDDAKREIFLCKEVVENIVSDRILCMSYPYGYEQSVSYREEKIAREANLIFCFTMEMCFNRDLTIAPHLLGRINNNEAPGHKYPAFKYEDGNFVITNGCKMKYHRTHYYSDF